MALANSAAWQSAYADPTKMPAVADTSWKANLALFFSDLTDDLLKCSTVYASAGVPAGSFTFNAAAFQAALSGSGLGVISNAWETAILASTMVVATGAFVGEPKTTANTFSAISSTVIDVASISAAKSYIAAQLAALTPVSTAGACQFPVVMRQAFLMLTVTISGSNSLGPPTALTAAGVSLI
jgi:hypothetical protein